MRRNAASAFEADGKKFAHTGDQFFWIDRSGASVDGDWARAQMMQNHVYRNGAFLESYRQTAQLMRDWRPDIVITGNFRDTWGSRFPNQADHIAVGRAALDAARDAGNRWVFPGEGGEPWNGVRAVWAAGSFEATHAVDVTETFAAGVDSLRAHKTYLEGLGDAFGDPEEFLESFARTSGTRLGCRYAVAFEVYPLQFT